jgi:ElaB/YqjD/DUF883 family membrane-anchored ribosome-binding protein
MTNVTDARAQTPSATEQVKDRVQDVAEQAKGQTRAQLREQINTRSTKAGEQISSTAGAMRRAGEQLRTEGNESVAKAVDGLADRGERLGGYLRQADGEQILRDVEGFARRQPWVFVGGSAVVGFLASRFMKASSRSRYQNSGPAHGTADTGRSLRRGGSSSIPSAAGASASQGGGRGDLE